MPAAQQQRMMQHMLQQIQRELGPTQHAAATGTTPAAQQQHASDNSLHQHYCFAVATSYTIFC
jgi:hypothetical protein